MMFILYWWWWSGQQVQVRGCGEYRDREGPREELRPGHRDQEGVQARACSRHQGEHESKNVLYTPEKYLLPGCGGCAVRGALRVGVLGGVAAQVRDPALPEQRLRQRRLGQWRLMQILFMVTEKYLARFAPRRSSSRRRCVPRWRVRRRRPHPPPPRAAASR